MINTCKTIGCPSFGVSDSKSYRFLDNDEVFCVECGYSFYLLDEFSFNNYIINSNVAVYKRLGYCGNCGSKGSLTNYGYSLSKKQRKKCNNCGSVFSIPSKFQVMSPMELDIKEIIHNGDSLVDYKKDYNVSSKVLGRYIKKINASSCLNYYEHNNHYLDIYTEVIKIKYNSSNNLLYVIFSCCLVTGKLIHLTTNYSPESELGNELKYDGYGALNKKTISIEEDITFKEDEISSREKFFEINYGESSLKRNESGMIVKPVYSSYQHFEILRRKLPSSKIINHFIEHESFIYASCLSSFYSEVITNDCNIFYVKKRLGNSFEKSYLFHLDNYWKDSWRVFTTEKLDYALCGLTSPVVDKNNYPLLGKGFKEFLDEHPFHSQLSKMNARNVTYILEVIAAQYNSKLE